jgi:hypothetical protein
VIGGLSRSQSNTGICVRHADSSVVILGGMFCAAARTGGRLPEQGVTRSAYRSLWTSPGPAGIADGDAPE